MDYGLWLLAGAPLVAGVLVAAVFTIGARPRRARIGPDGCQEATVMVKGRYSPDAIEVRRGMPVKLNFRRDEDTPCSEQVILSAFHAGARLAPYQTTSVDFVPDRCGDFLFTCAMGMYQGRIVVVEPSQRDLNKARRAAQLQAVKGGAWEEARRTGVVRDASAQRGFRLPDGPQPGSASGRTSGGAPGIQAITGTGQHPED